MLSWQILPPEAMHKHSVPGRIQPDEMFEHGIPSLMVPAHFSPLQTPYNRLTSIRLSFAFTTLINHGPLIGQWLTWSQTVICQTPPDEPAQSAIPLPEQRLLSPSILQLPRTPPRVQP